MHRTRRKVIERLEPPRGPTRSARAQKGDQLGHGALRALQHGNGTNVLAALQLQEGRKIIPSQHLATTARAPLTVRAAESVRAWRSIEKFPRRTEPAERADQLEREH